MKLLRFKILELMEREGISTQKNLADRIGVTQQALSAWMRGGTFTVDNLAALCVELKCSPNDILSLPKECAPNPMIPMTPSAFDHAGSLLVV